MATAGLPDKPSPRGTPAVPSDVARRPQPRPATELTAEQAAALSERYWGTKDDRNRIARAFGIHVNSLLKYMAPVAAPGHCSICEGGLEYWNRTQRNAEDSVCVACGHHQNSDRCACPPCKAQREAAQLLQDERNRVATEEQDRQRAAAVARWEAQYATDEYVTQALRLLTPPQRLFLDGIVEAFAEGRCYFHWDQIARDCGVSPNRAPDWVNRFLRCKLLYRLDGEVGINQALYNTDILVPTGRRR